MRQLVIWSFMVGEEIKAGRLSEGIESDFNIGLRTTKAHASNTNGIGGKYVGVLLPLLSSMSCQMLLVGQDTFSSCVLIQLQNPSQHSTQGKHYQSMRSDTM